MIFLITLGAFTLQKNFGPDPPRKKYGPITFVKKYLSFRRDIGAYGPVETSVFLYKRSGSVLLFLAGPDQNFSVV